MIVVAALLQAAAPPPPLPPAASLQPPLRIDLLSVVQHCPDVPAGGDVVVCGRPGDRRLHQITPPASAVAGPPLTLHLPGGGTGNLHAIQTTQPGGAVGRGVAATVRIPLGKSAQ